MSNNAGSGGQPPASTSTGTLKEVKDDIRPVSTASHTTDNDDDLPVTKPIISETIRGRVWKMIQLLGIGEKLTAPRLWMLTAL
jgi:hypothetical protein